MNFDRTKNAKRSIVSGLMVKFLTIIVPFIMRTIIIYTLGNLYLGLGSLFASILNTLSLAELGIGSALIFSMYKPVAENDREKICALLNVYKRIYYIIGIVILVVGMVLLPFLPDLIKGAYPRDINIFLLYIIQLLSTVSGYFFFAYKGSILTVYQRVDITNLVNFILDMFMYILQIISLIVLKNYYVYVLLILAKSIISNMIIAKIVRIKYPNLVAAGQIDRETQKQILKKTGALTAHRIAEVVINSTDNILVSMFIGLNMVAIYNNYYYVLTAVSGIIFIVFSAMIPIVGNYLITENSDNIIKLFGILNYINAFSIAMCCSCFINMYQPFIKLWTGENNLFPMYMVILFTMYFYALRIRTVMTLFQNAAGIWEKDLVKAYAMTIINLLIDIILIQKIGIAAALISTIVSMIFAFVYEAIVVHKYVLNRDSGHFFAMNIMYICSAVVCSVASFGITSFFNEVQDVYKLFVGGIVSLLVSPICFIGITYWCQEFKDSLKFLKKKIRQEENCE